MLHSITPIRAACLFLLGFALFFSNACSLLVENPEVIPGADGILNALESLDA